MKPLTENLSFQVTFDNLFTSFNLLQYQRSKGIGATGTLRANRTVKQWNTYTILLTKSSSQDGMTTALSLQHPIATQLSPLGKKNDTQERKGRSLKLMSPMLFSTITKTWVGWVAQTKILASTESLSALRNGGCHCSCLGLMLPCKMIGYFTGTQMQASKNHSICWVSEEKLSIFTAENTRLDNLGLALLDTQFLLLQENL